MLDGFEVVINISCLIDIDRVLNSQFNVLNGVLFFLTIELVFLRAWPVTADLLEDVASWLLVNMFRQPCITFFLRVLVPIRSGDSLILIAICPEVRS